MLDQATSAMQLLLAVRVLLAIGCNALGRSRRRPAVPPTASLLSQALSPNGVTVRAWRDERWTCSSVRVSL